MWVDDDDFDLGRHLHHAALPAPGGRRELAEMCGQITAHALDRDHPLWEMWVIEGLQHDALAVVFKAHHAVVDGIGGANLLAQLCGTEADAAPPRDSAAGAGAAHPLQIAASGLIGTALRPWRLAKVVPATAVTLAQTVLRVRGGGHTMAAPFAAPATVFNGSCSRRRCVAFAEVDFEDIKKVKNRFGVTVNDVVTALCAGALRQYLQHRGELTDRPLVASVPVSVHGESGRPGRNQTSWMLCRIETHIEDPAERLRSVAAGNGAAKEHARAMGPTLLHDWTQVAGRTVFGAATKLLPRIPLPQRPPHNLVLSNVPGPAQQLYFLGCRLDGMYPLGPLVAGAGLNVTVMSLNGRLGIGIVSCPDLVSDLWDLADAFPAALKELLNCSERGPGSHR